MLLCRSGPALAGEPDILAGLRPAELCRVTMAGHPVPFAAGGTLFRQGDPHDGIFILQRGTVRSFHAGPSGREITLGHWGPGSFVGGPDIFGEGPHVWSGVALTPGAALRLPGAALRRLMHEIPAFAVGLVDGLAFKGRCYAALLQLLATRSVSEHLALLLPTLSTGPEAPAPTEEELAGRVGATPQAVSAALERFRAAGLIELGDRRLAILDAPALRAAAAGRGAD